MKTTIHAFAGGLLVLAFALALQGTATAVELRGVPLTQWYGPEDYAADAPNLDVAVDAEGQVFAANNDGVLHFDGTGWHVLPMPDAGPARQVERGADGRIYVGGHDHFGVLEALPEGSIRYRDLRPTFGLDGDGAAEVGVVWRVLAAPDGVWFRTEHELLFYAHGNGRHRRLTLSAQARLFFVADGRLYGRTTEQGLVRLDGGELVPVPGGAVFREQGLKGVVPHEHGLLLAGSTGFHLLDEKGIRRLPADLDPALRAPVAMPVMALADGSVVIGTGAGEVLRYGRDLRLTDRIPLTRQAIRGFDVDADGALWVATLNGLARMQLPSRWTRFGDVHGVHGQIHDIESHDRALWLATSDGLLRVAADGDAVPRAQRQAGVDLEAFALRATPPGLLVGHRHGLLEIAPGGRQRPLLSGSGLEWTVHELLPSRFDPGRMYARGVDALWLLRLVGERWEVAAHWPLDGIRPSGLVETADDELWIDDARAGVWRLHVDAAQARVVSRQPFEVSDGAGRRSIYLLDGRLHMRDGERCLVFADGRFMPDTDSPCQWLQGHGRIAVAHTARGEYAYSRQALYHRATPQAAWRMLRIGDITPSYRMLRVGADGMLRIATVGGQVLQYDPGESETATSRPLRLHLAGAELRQGEQPARALPVRDVGSSGLSVPSGSHLLLRYGLMTMEPGVQFRYRIEGVSADWSAWSAAPELAMQVRVPGSYRIHIQARTASAREVTPLEFPLTVRARWHETVTARAAAGALALLLLALAVHGWLRWRTRRYLTVQQRLEAHIAARTSELEQANRKLEELAVEDALTGVANRRALEQALHREWYRCLDLKRPLAVLMIDVDHFKEYNDTHGHLAGDAALRRVAGLLGEGVDPTRELLARYGGEEFVLLMPGEHPDRAHARAEALRLRIAGRMPGNSVSIGVVSRVPNGESEPNLLLGRADEALYRAKRNGRNRVEIADAD